MSDQAMSEAALLISLRDIRLPVEAAGGWVSDIAAVVGLAGLLAVLIAALLRAASLRRSVSGADVKGRVLAITKMPEDARRVAMLHLLKEQRPARYADVKGALYQPGGGVDIATLEAEVADLV